MTQYLQDPALWGLIVGAPLGAAAIYRGRKSNARLRDENRSLRDYYANLEAGHSAVVAEAQSNAEEATKTALKTAMRTLQGLANEQQLVISRLQEKYGDSQILQDLLEIDHTNTQFGRRAQAIAVLCDGWLGRQRAVASLYDVVRSAKGRIRHFTRVEIRAQSNLAVVSRAVEPVALAIAELLDNATSYSAPETHVEINIRTVPKGVCIIVDDAGVGMLEEERNRAARLLAPRRPTGVTGLGNPPQFGFAVIGVLAARYGFSVSADTRSPYGGVRAVVFVPSALLTHRDTAEELPPVTAPPARAASSRTPAASSRTPAASARTTESAGATEPGRTPVSADASDASEAALAPAPASSERVPGRSAGLPLPAETASAAAAATTAGGLPKRRRRAQAQAEPAAAAQEPPAPLDDPGDRSAEETARRMGAFARGTLHGRAAQDTTPHDDEGNIQG